MRVLLLSMVILLAGCSGPEYSRPDWGSTGEPWDTTYLLDDDPDSVNLHLRAKSLETHYWQFAQVEGVCLEPARSDVTLALPDSWGDGGDSGIYTGTALAAWSFKWSVTQDVIDLARVFDTLRAVWLLTHAPGPGVICRVAFPANMEEEFSYPEHWQHRIDGGFVHKSAANIADPVRGGVLPETIYYTRATKDQLTGILLGLSACWKLVGPEHAMVRDVIRQCARDLHDHLKKHKWYIRDENGKNDTNSDHVDGLLKTQLFALLAQTEPTCFRAAYLDEFTVSGLGDLFVIFNNSDQYYAWNLRYSRALSVWLLEDNADRREELAEFVEDCLWDNTSGHQNGWFAAIQAGMNNDVEAKAVLIDSLKSLALKPTRNYSAPYVNQLQKPNIFEVLFGLEDKYVLPPHLRKPTGYSTWQKEPWDVSQADPAPDKNPWQDDTGLSFLMAYWCGRYFRAL